MTFDLQNLKYLVIDVDGTMTDAGIYYDENGNELKKFCTIDAAAFFVAKKINIKIIVLTGRNCMATGRRMKELGVPYLFQGVKNKVAFLSKFMNDNNISSEQLGYIGDDLNDFAPMKLAGFKACPANSCKEIMAIADYVSTARGGQGAIREIFENCIAKEKWSLVINQIYAGI